jgi:putative addiction module CopG family antidote
MTTTQQYNITLPPDIAEAVEAKIKSGAYNSVDDVVHEGIRALLEHDAVVAQWLREEVVPSHQQYLADPAQVVPADQVLPRIKQRRAAGKHYRTS